MLHSLISLFIYDSGSFLLSYMHLLVIWGFTPIYYIIHDLGALGTAHKIQVTGSLQGDK